MLWREACSPDSPAKKDIPEPDAPDTFISSHLSAMNPCQHPSVSCATQGEFLSGACGAD